MFQTHTKFKLLILPLLLIIGLAGCDSSDSINSPPDGTDPDVTYTVTLSSNPAAGGATSGAGIFNSGDSKTVTASPNTGYTFTNWTVNDSIVATTGNHTFTLSGDISIVANFFAAATIDQETVTLGSASQFALLSSTDITNIPTSAITGDVGISPGVRSSISGLTDPEVSGSIYASDDADPVPAMLTAARDDAEAAYLDAVAAVRGTPVSISGNINGLTFTPGLYESGGSIEISPGGILYLDAQGDAEAVFVIRSATSITTEATSEVVLTNSAHANNIFWVAGSAITLGTDSRMQGTLIASTSISLLTNARLDGRALIQGAASGQISLDQNIIVIP